MCTDKITRPKLLRDWKDGYVRMRRPLSNGYAELPVGTVFKVKSTGPTTHLESLPCSCCGFIMKMTIRGSNKFADDEWLGYDATITA